jgi:hypothetical protein
LHVWLHVWMSWRDRCGRPSRLERHVVFLGPVLSLWWVHVFSQINRDKADKGLLIPSGSLWIPLDPSGNQRWPWKITWIGTGRSRNIWTIGGCSSTSSESCCAPHDSFRGILSGAEVILIDGDSHHLLHLHEVDFARAISEEALRPYHLFLGRHVQWHAATSVAGVSRIRRMQGWMFHTLGLRFVIPTANDCTILV